MGKHRRLLLAICVFAIGCAIAYGLKWAGVTDFLAVIGASVFWALGFRFVRMQS
jgi:hypothetical protein